MKSLNHFFKTLFLFTIIGCFTACDNDIEENTQTSNIEITRRLISNEGFVISQNNLPVQNATISIEGKVVAQTREDGSFHIDDAELKPGKVLVFEHKDYVTVTKVLQEDTYLTLWMKKRAEAQTIDPRKNNKIRVGKAGFIEIPSNALGFENQVYNEPINIQATYIDVTNSFDLRSAPGSYIAQDNDRLLPLTSFGMIEIVATTLKEENRLDLVEGATIRTILPVSREIETPRTVNLYSFDTSTGYWELQGELLNNGSFLVGEITSINSAWNADEPCSENLVCVKIKVVFTNGNPGCGVAVEGLSYQGYDGLHSIGSDGYVSLMVCPDSVFELQSCFPLCISCPGPIYTTIIDLSTVTTPPGPDGCIDIGTWTITN